MSSQSQLEEIDLSIAKIDSTINALQAKRRELVERRQGLQDALARQTIVSAPLNEDSYEQEDFSWSDDLKRLAKTQFKISSFRQCQLPIINAALDQKRDLFVVLPTGGGKSLCYQLPTLLETGFTLVISPLVSLIRDQVFQLEEMNVPAVALTGASTKEEVANVQLGMAPLGGQEPPFKLLYVTPEKIAKSKRFMARLDKAYNCGALTRIVVDEAHCCSQQGHDFRPDYKQLSILRTLFPKTKIMALTATCPWSVMKDVMRILNMKQPQFTDGTLVYSSPLYRPNLVYSVLPKPEKDDELIKEITNWILTNYPNDSGIIYCLSKKDTEVVSSKIYAESKGRIKCAAYHADLQEEDKEYIHHRWRRHELHVIVATIAFGMGINHLTTRFVIHHCMSKSLEGYYQESGRAGRDGKRSECILYYRGNDAMRLSSFVVSDINGKDSLYEMVNYAQTHQDCRKILFERYFSLDTDGVVNRITLDETCGICDNCTRENSEQSVAVEDIIDVARSMVRLSNTVIMHKEKATMSKLVQMLRGRQLGLMKSRVMNSSQIKIPVDSKYTDNDLERIINQLIKGGYLDLDFKYTPYSTITYVTIGELSNILLDDTLDEFHMEFLRAGKKKRAATDTNSSSGARKRAITDSPIEITSDMDPSSAAKKRAVTELAPEIKFDMDFEIDFDDDFNMEPRQPVSSLNRKKGKEIITID